MRRFACLTNAFSKQFDNHWSGPAMAAALTDTLMEMSDLAAMIDAANLPKKQGAYKKRG